MLEVHIIKKYRVQVSHNYINSGGGCCRYHTVDACHQQLPPHNDDVTVESSHKLDVPIMNPSLCITHAYRLRLLSVSESFSFLCTPETVSATLNE